MPHVAYDPRGFAPEAASVIDQAAAFCDDYASQGYDLTLRQLYYLFVSSDAFPDARTWTQVGSKWVRDPDGTKNAEPNYKWLGDLMSKARLAGLIDWDHIKDRGRELVGSVGGYETPSQIVHGLDRRFSMDRWKGQPLIIETWVEKQALEDVIGRASWRWDAPYFACKGYASLTAMWEAAQRIKGYMEEGYRVLVLHLGDHDPSGVDMSRDIDERLVHFLEHDFATGLGTYGDPWSAVIEEFGIEPNPDAFDGSGALLQTEGALEIRRIALNMGQVRQYDPPPNPTKVTDSRAASYIDQFGMTCWELDALDPATLDALIQDEIRSEIDMTARAVVLEEEREGRTALTALSEHWAEIEAHMREQGWVGA